MARDDENTDFPTSTVYRVRDKALGGRITLQVRLYVGADFANPEENPLKVKDERTGLFTQGDLSAHDETSICQYRVHALDDLRRLAHYLARQRL